MKMTSPKNEDDLTQKRRQPHPKKEDDLIQKIKTTSEIYPQKKKTLYPKNEDDLTQNWRRPHLEDNLIQKMESPSATNLRPFTQKMKTTLPKKWRQPGQKKQMTSPKNEDNLTQK